MIMNPSKPIYIPPKVFGGCGGIQTHNLTALEATVLPIKLRTLGADHSLPTPA